jgi:hypothetical protein
VEKPLSRKTFLYKAVFNWPMAIILMVMGSLLLSMFVVFYIDFIRVDEIQMKYFDDDACRLKIPVRYIYSGEKLEYTYAVSFVNSNGWRYSVRQNRNSNEIWIQISRLGFGGLTAYAAHYEITDSIVRKQLMEMMSAKEIKSKLTVLDSSNDNPN